MNASMKIAALLLAGTTGLAWAGKAENVAAAQRAFVAAAHIGLECSLVLAPHGARAANTQCRPGPAQRQAGLDILGVLLDALAQAAHHLHRPGLGDAGHVGQQRRAPARDLPQVLQHHGPHQDHRSPSTGPAHGR